MPKQVTLILTAFNKRRRVSYASLLALVVIAAYVAIASIKLTMPGTQYDEALYVNAALGGIDKITFLTKTFHGFPVLLMPYIGALKAYIFHPIFAIFGVTAVSMRLPVIFITALGLSLFYKAIRKQVGSWLALGALAVTALDAGFISLTRFDNGPVVLAFFLKVLGIVLLLRLLRTKSLWWWSLFWGVMVLGVFNKLNFIWDVHALAGAFILVYGIRIWKTLDVFKRVCAVLITACGYASCVLYYAYITFQYHLQGSFGFVGWTTIHNNLVELIRGSWFYNYALSPRQIGTDAVFWVMFLTLIAGAVVLCYLVWRKSTVLRPPFTDFFFFIGLALILQFIQIIITQQATAAWHYFSIYPLFGTLFVLALAIIAKTQPTKRQSVTTVLFIAIVVGLCTYYVAVYREYLVAYGQPTTNIIWSPGIYTLIDYTKATTNTAFISLDWGTQTQLIGFDPIPNKYYEMAGPVLSNNPAEAAFILNTYILSKPHALYITHPEGQRITNTTSQFFSLASQYNYSAKLIKSISYGGHPVFGIYTITHN